MEFFVKYFAYLFVLRWPKIIFIVLVSCVNLQAAIPSPRIRLLKQEKSFDELSTSNECTLANYTEVDFSSLETTNVSTPIWTAQYTTWINFIGCFEGQINNHSNYLDFSYNKTYIVESCLLHCNFTAFVLKKQKCFCKSDVFLYNSSKICEVSVCQKGQVALCPKINSRCMCEYEPVNIKEDVDGNDDCMMVSRGEERLRFTSQGCFNKSAYVCKEDTRYNEQTQNPLIWNFAACQCFSDKRRPVIYSHCNMSELNDKLRNKNTFFWIGVFRKPVFRKNRPVCLSVKNDNGKAKPIVKNCTDHLPALCISEDVISSTTKLGSTEYNVSYRQTTEYTKSTTMKQTSHDLVSSKSDRTTTDTDFTITPMTTKLTTVQDREINETKNTENTKPGSILTITLGASIGSALLLLGIIIAAILCWKKRKHTRSTFKKTYEFADMTQRNHITNIETTGNTGVVPNMISNGENETIQKTIDSQKNKDTSEKTTDDEYGHLNIGGKIKRLQEQPDDYDTMANISAGNNTEYGTLSIGLNKTGDTAQKVQNLGDYDTMASISAASNSEYGTLSIGLNKTGDTAQKVQNLGDYDTMANISAGNNSEYGTLSIGLNKTGDASQKVQNLGDYDTMASISAASNSEYGTLSIGLNKIGDTSQKVQNLGDYDTMANIKVKTDNTT